MARGVTNQPLRIYVAPQWLSHPAVLDLMRAGHNVYATPTVLHGADLILHPAAHGWNEHMFPYLPAALTAARARRGKK